jgi:hypothetical protein
VLVVEVEVLDVVVVLKEELELLGAVLDVVVDVLVELEVVLLLEVVVGAVSLPYSVT